ncbi:MAG: cystathionine beta-lyase [Pseudomonadota bacterium]
MSDTARKRATATQLAHVGRTSAKHDGFVNTPVYRGSTVLHPDVATLKSGAMPTTYGRRGSPLVRGLEEQIALLEGGASTVMVPSGLSAVTSTLIALVHSGDHILMVDSVYKPTRMFCETVLRRLGVETEYYDPLIGEGIADLLRENTRLVYTESPGSQTFEVQDLPAIAAAAHARNALVVLDNTWASPLYFKSFTHGADVSIQAATKYIVGHSDAMLGSVTMTDALVGTLDRDLDLLGNCAGTEEIYLGQRGMRTIAVRLRQHWESGLTVARWLQQHPLVERVLHPALESHPQHALWSRDFEGASGLFSFLLPAASDAALAAMLDTMELFGMGYSWGGFESLAVPFDPRSYRTATTWPHAGHAIRLHIGLEDPGDLISDLEAGLARFDAARGHGDT